MKRVVWVYRSYKNAPERYKGFLLEDGELFTEKELRVFSGAVTSWEIYAPDCVRALYVDEEIYNELKQKQLLTKFQEIYVVDFSQEIDEQYPDIYFFATPKLWVVGQQKEPFILCDTETTLFWELDSFLKPEFYGFVRYDRENSICYHNWTKEDLEGFELLKQELQESGTGYEAYLDPNQMVNAGFSTWVRPADFKKISNILLSVCSQVCKSKVQFSKKWTFCEESILLPIIRSIPDSKIFRYPTPFYRFGQTGPFVEWSGPTQEPEVYENYKLWMSKQRKVSEFRRLDPYAEY